VFDGRIVNVSIFLNREPGGLEMKRAMTSIYDLKPAFQKLLRPVVGWLFARGVTPNQVTLIALALSLVTGLLLALASHYPSVFLVVPVVCLLRMGLNAIDGMLAREHELQTPAGALLNELGDVISDAALYLPFCLLPGTLSWLIVVIVIMGVISEVAGLAALHLGVSRRNEGPMGKSDRAFAFGLLGLLIGLGMSPENWVIQVGYVMVVVLLGYTIRNRFKAALQKQGAE